jgi:hypothetical protein
MIDLLILTFCRIDDFCIIYEKSQNLKSIGKIHNRKYGVESKLSTSEVMTILIMFQAVKYRNFKTFYTEFMLIYWKKYFPSAPSYNRFVELIPNALVPLTEFVSQHSGKHTDIYYVDATKLPVCHNLREKRHKVFGLAAGKSKTSTGWFFGLKLHLVVNNLCEIMSFRVTRGNVDDRTPLLEMCKSLKGMLFGDRGYISKPKSDLLKTQELKLITTLKKNMKKVSRTRYERQLLRQRGIIETMFGYLKNSLMLWHTRHRSPVNACAHLMACLANWIIEPISIIGQKRLNAM